jgi:hypothetical protein
MGNPFNFISTEMWVVVWGVAALVAIAGLAGGVFSSEGKASLLIGMLVAGFVVAFISTEVDGGNKSQLILLYLCLYIASIWVGAYLKNIFNSFCFMWRK